MRPDLELPIRLLFPIPSCLPGAFGSTLGAGLALCAGIELAAPRTSEACPVPWDLEDTIFLEIAPGRNVEVSIGGMTRADEGPSCAAWASVPLSAFPSTRLATRPADVARSLRDAVEKMGATECVVSVLLENDTGEEIADHELCLTETFRFGERRVWSSGAEAFCWEPDPVVEAEPAGESGVEAIDEEPLVFVE